MGIYIDPGNAAFEMSRFSDIYIDKSMLISRVNALYRTAAINIFKEISMLNFKEGNGNERNEWIRNERIRDK